MQVQKPPAEVAAESTPSTEQIGGEAAQDAQPRGLLFGVCDQPYLTRGTLLRLLAAFDRAPERIVAPCHAGRRGNPVIFPARFLPELGALSGDVGGSAVIRAHPEALLLVPAEDGRELADIDTRPGQ